MIHHLHREQLLSAAIDQVWAFFSDPRNLNEITPPEMRFEIITPLSGEMYEGQIIEYRIELIKGFKTKWLTEITHVVPGRYFVDEQRIGPYKFWHHQHTFIPEAQGVRMVDHVTYAAGYGVFGSLATKLWIKKKLNTIFDYRQSIIEKIFAKDENYESKA
ncbi:SRPBCC family protein [candidate division KSB1 bacterium]|nr:SRPBCC family protein [candidate division KSB1 bacterium]